MSNTSTRRCWEEGFALAESFRSSLFQGYVHLFGKQLVSSAKLGLAEAASRFHSIQASLVSAVLVPVLFPLCRWEAETPTPSCPWRCPGQAGGNELGELFCSALRGQSRARCLDKKLRVHVMLPHPARCILRRLFTNTGAVLEQARLLTNPARQKSLRKPRCLPVSR